MSPDLPGPATPEINRALRARVEQLLGEYDRVRRNVTQMRQRLAAAQAQAQSKDGSIKVTVGPRGELRELEIGPRAYRRLSPSEMAAEILDLSGQATRDVETQLEQVMAPFLPKGVTYAQVLAGQVDPSAWAPAEPVTSETFDTWWSAIGNEPAVGQGSDPAYGRDGQTSAGGRKETAT